MHREAQYYAIGPLLESLEDIQPLTGEKVRQAFLDLLPYYKGEPCFLLIKCKEVSIHEQQRPSEQIMSLIRSFIDISLYGDKPFQ